MRLVTLKKLTDVFQVTRHTLVAWHRSGFLVPSTNLNTANHYSFASIDEILQKGAKNLTRGISAAAVLSGEVKLLTLNQAAEKLETTPDALWHRIARGGFPAIRLGGEWRIIEDDIDDFLRQNKESSYLHREMVAHIFGSLSYVKNCVQDGELRCVTISAKPVIKPITLKSILDLLEEITPPWVTPQGWIAERQRDLRPLLGLAEFERFLGLTAHTGRKVLTEKKVAYLQTKLHGTLMGISPVSADHLLLQQEVLTFRQIGNLFGVNERAAEKAWRANVFQCRPHTHIDSGLRRACALELLRSCLSPGILTQRAKWYEEHLNYSDTFVSVVQAANFYKITAEQVILYLRNGKLHGVTLPGSTEWHVVRDVLRVL